MNKFDTRQSEFRGILQQLIPYLSNQQLSVILQSIDSDLTAPLRVEASNPSDLVVHIGPSVVSNPESSRNRSISFINGTIPSLISGTVTFPSANGGNIVASPGSTTVLTLPSNNYAKALLSLDQGGSIHVTVGTPDPSLGSTIVPPPPQSTTPFAYLILFNNAGTVQSIGQNDIFQIEGSGGASGSIGFAQQVSIGSGSTSIVVTFPSPLVTTSYSVIASIANLTDSNPEFIPIVITNKTVSGFTASWNTPTDSSNYLLDYIVPGVEEQLGEAALSSGSVSATVTLPVPLSTTSYVVAAVMVNYTDSNPQFQPVTITGKTASSFNVKWNAPLDSSNYRLAFQVALYQ